MAGAESCGIAHIGNVASSDMGTLLEAEAETCRVGVVAHIGNVAFRTIAKLILQNLSRLHATRMRLRVSPETVPGS